VSVAYGVAQDRRRQDAERELEAKWRVFWMPGGRRFQRSARRRLTRLNALIDPRRDDQTADCGPLAARLFSSHDVKGVAIDGDPPEAEHLSKRGTNRHRRCICRSVTKPQGLMFHFFCVAVHVPRDRERSRERCVRSRSARGSEIRPTPSDPSFASGRRLCHAHLSPSCLRKAQADVYPARIYTPLRWTASDRGTRRRSEQQRRDGPSSIHARASIPLGTDGSRLRPSCARFPLPAMSTLN
jgi:hypothetical protein